MTDELLETRRPLENPRTFLVRVSRRQFRELSLRFVLVPTLDGPRLVFPPGADQALATVLDAELDTWREARTKTRNPEKLKRIARAARDAHLRRVELAIGYTWPGNPPGHIAFAPDE